MQRDEVQIIMDSDEAESLAARDRRGADTAALREKLGLERPDAYWFAKYGRWLRRHAVPRKREVYYPFDAEAYVIMVGATMETTALELATIKEEVESSKKVLQDLSNQVRALRDVIEPDLLNHIKALRQARMTVVDEMRLALTSMRDVRKFFLESDYKEEVARLREFINLCQTLNSLKADGTLDAICDSALRLLVKK